MEFFTRGPGFSFAGIAQQVASQVEKQIDKALDISEEASASAVITVAPKKTSLRDEFKRQPSMKEKGEEDPTEQSPSSPGSKSSSTIFYSSPSLASSSTPSLQRQPLSPPPKQSPQSPSGEEDDGFFSSLPLEKPQSAKAPSSSSPQPSSSLPDSPLTSAPSSPSPGALQKKRGLGKSLAGTEKPGRSLGAAKLTKAADPPSEIPSPTHTPAPAEPPPPQEEESKKSEGGPETKEEVQSGGEGDQAREGRERQESGSKRRASSPKMPPHQEGNPVIEETKGEPLEEPAQAEKIPLAHAHQASSFSNKDLDKIFEKLAQREQQVITLTEENASLQAMLASQGHSSDPDGAKEKERLRQLAADYEGTISQKEQEITELKNAIQGLYAEGEKLSIEQGKDRKKIKELKAKETALEKQKSELQDKLDQANRKVETLQLDLKAAERYKEIGLKTQEISDSHVKRITELEQSLKEANSREATLKTSLERAFKEIADLRKENLESMNKAQSEALELEIKKNEEMHQQWEGFKRQAEEREATLRRELIELRASFHRIEDEAGWREDNLRREISALQAKLQASNARNEELASGMEDMAQPLLRQIEALQNQASVNMKTWQQLELSLTQQLHHVQAEKSAAVEKERNLQDQLGELMSKLSSTESQLSSERHSKALLSQQLEVEKRKGEDYESKYSLLSAKLETERYTQTKSLEETKENYQKLLRRQLEEEREKFEKKLEEEVRKAKELSANEFAHSLQNTPATIDLSRNSSSSNLSTHEQNLSAFDASSSGTFNGEGGLALEKLTANLRRKEEEIEALKEQLKSILSSRDGIAEELLRETSEKEKIQREVSKISLLTKELEDLSTRYNAALELLGEKTEEVEELKNDLTDVKQIFREQVSELLDKIETLSKVQPGPEKQ